MVKLNLECCIFFNKIIVLLKIVNVLEKICHLSVTYIYIYFLQISWCNCNSKPIIVFCIQSWGKCIVSTQTLLFVKSFSEAIVLEQKHLCEWEEHVLMQLAIRNFSTEIVVSLLFLIDVHQPEQHMQYDAFISQLDITVGL